MNVQHNHQHFLARITDDKRYLLRIFCNKMTIMTIFFHLLQTNFLIKKSERYLVLVRNYPNSGTFIGWTWVVMQLDPNGASVCCAYPWYILSPENVTNIIYEFASYILILICYFIQVPCLIEQTLFWYFGSMYMY